MSDNSGLLGHLAVKKGLITREQLRMATLEQARHPDKRIGEILIALGLLDEAQLESLLAAQRGLQSRMQRNRRVTPPPSKRVVDPVALGSIALKRVPRSVAKGGAPSKEVAADMASPEPSVDDGGSVKTVGFAMPRPKEARREPDTRRWLLSILGDAIECGASDVLFRPDEPVRVRRFGRLQDLTNGPVPARATEPLLNEILEESERVSLERSGHVRTTYEHLEVGRFRLDVFRHHHGVGGVFHRVPREPPSIADLGLPSVLAGLTNFGRGLVVIVGPRGSGKSSTLAALLDLINAERSDHVLTIEDTVECVIRSQVANVSQLRWAGTSTPGWLRCGGLRWRTPTWWPWTRSRPTTSCGKRFSAPRADTWCWRLSPVRARCAPSSASSTRTTAIARPPRAVSRPVSRPSSFNGSSPRGGIEARWRRWRSSTSGRPSRPPSATARSPRSPR
ncbi:MAG: ATPase, T2SS/T4P/T4SS family [Polyangiaceae bacterium]